MKCINLGCGSFYITNKDWINFDFSSNSEHIIAANLIQGIPLDDDSVDVIYHSNILEHFLPNDAHRLIDECYRVLKPNGYMRIAIPDLETIVREYLRNLEAVLNNDSEINQANYHWILLELIDQMARNISGGQMLEFWNQDTIINYDYIKERVGFEFSLYRDAFLKNKQQDFSGSNCLKHPILSKIKKTAKKVLKPAYHRHNEKYTEIGKFRLGGEVHQWMYDRYSLPKLLKKHKFSDINQVCAQKTLIPNWTDHIILDLIDGNPRKPDSIFFEAKKVL